MTTAGIKLTLDVGDAVSAAGRYSGALHHINEEVQKAEQLAKKTNKPEDWDRFAKLTFDRDRMKNSSSSFDRSLKTLANSPKFQTQGPNGQTIFKADPEFVSIMKTHVDAIKKLTTAYETAAPGSDEAHDLAFQIENQQKAFSKAIESATGTGKQGNGTENAVKSIFAQQIVNAINSGLQLWVSSADRTASINAYGSGDIIGGSFAERQRRANAWSGGLQTVGALAQGVGMAFGPVGMIAGTATNLTATLVARLIERDTKIAGNKVAYANLWEGQADQAMNLAAMLGDPSNVRGKWGEAAGIAQRHGFSAEEGMDALKAAAMQGLGGNAVQQVLDYERRTGADRSVLSSVSYLSGRYGGGDALRAGWQGLNASGMSTAQYTEFLRGIQRAMEDGIGKGFNRSADEIARNQAMLAQMTNYNPLWTGEQGANRLMKMYGGFENSTGMQDSTDILAFRAARGILGENADYVDVMKYLEDPENFAELFNKFRELVDKTEGGDRAAIVEHFRKQFRMTYHEADTLRAGGTFTDEQMRAIQNRQRGLPEDGSAELRSAVESMRVRNLVIEGGQGFWDIIKPEAIIEALNEYQKTTGALVAGAGNTDVPIPAPEVPYNIREEIGRMDSMRIMNLPRYFGHGGDRRSDNTAETQFGLILDRATRSNNEDEISAAFNVLNILNRLPKTKSDKWDSEDALNPLANSGNAAELLNALNRLIEIEERDTGINITFTDN